jgi:hypothetical protein
MPVWLWRLRLKITKPLIKRRMDRALNAAGWHPDAEGVWHRYEVKP